MRHLVDLVWYGEFAERSVFQGCARPASEAWTRERGGGSCEKASTGMRLTSRGLGAKLPDLQGTSVRTSHHLGNGTVTDYLVRTSYKNPGACRCTRARVRL
jgi:hypothetical protein